MKSLHKHITPDSLPTQYGGKVAIPDGTGSALGDLFKLYAKEFESKHFFYTFLFHLKWAIPMEIPNGKF